MQGLIGVRASGVGFRVQGLKGFELRAFRRFAFQLWGAEFKSSRSHGFWLLCFSRFLG